MKISYRRRLHVCEGDSDVGRSIPKKQAQFKPPASIRVDAYQANPSTNQLHSGHSKKQTVSSIRETAGSCSSGLPSCSAGPRTMPALPPVDRADVCESQTERAREHQGNNMPGFAGILEEISQLRPELGAKIDHTVSDKLRPELSEDDPKNEGMVSHELLAEVVAKDNAVGMFDRKTKSSTSPRQELADNEAQKENQTSTLKRSTESVGNEAGNIVQGKRTRLIGSAHRSLGGADKGFTNSKFRMPAPITSNCESLKASEILLDVALPHMSNGSRTAGILGIKANESRGKLEDKVSSDYYIVMYCNRKPNKKHKGPWSDGVLIRRGRSFVLQDTEGKVVQKDGDKRGGGDMSEGATLDLGKYEIEVMRTSTEGEYLSGKIFLETIDIPSDAISKLFQRRALKPFQAPGVVQQARVSKSEKVVASFGVPTQEVSHKVSTDETMAAPLVIPTMQAASKMDQLMLNAKDSKGVPIIVDPYLASKLRQHQREGVKFMYECIMGMRNSSFTGCLLADAMGLGKTLQVIALIWTLLKQGPGGRPAAKRVLVICPSSLVENWGKEVRKWLGNERLTPLLIHSGTSPMDVKRKLSNFQVGKVYHLLITSYELLRKHKDDLKSAKPDLLVCDEAHRLKNCAGNKTIDALLDLHCSKRLILTGTPIQNDLLEFYAMMDFANPTLLGPLPTFKRLYACPIEKSRDRDASEEEKRLGLARSAELQSRTRFCILQRGADVNSKYLPAKTEFVVFCKLQPSQAALYQNFIKSKLVSESLATMQSAVSLSAIGMLRKLCNYPGLVEHELTRSGFDGNMVSSRNGEGPRLDSTSADWSLSGKLACLYRILLAVHESSISNSRDKIVVVSNFTQTLDIIQMLCEKQRWSWLRLDGTTNVSERQSLVDRFNGNGSEGNVFLLSSKAGGAGLNLIGANRLVLFDPDWNPATDAQAMARVWRDGQTKAVFIYRLLSTGSIEEKIYQRQIMKGEVAATVEDHVEGQGGIGDGGGRRHFSREELRELLTLRLDTCCDTHDLLSRSESSHLERWRDYMNDVEDYALKDAISTGVVTFVHQTIDRKDSKSSVEGPREQVGYNVEGQKLGLDSEQTDIPPISSDVLIHDISEPLGQQQITIDHDDERLPGSDLEGEANIQNNMDNDSEIQHDQDKDPAEEWDCQLESKSHETLKQLLELWSPTEHNFDELEALDAPFLCSLELEMELMWVNFQSKDLWQGFKLFVIGFIFGAEEERVSYRNSKLGTVLHKCNIDRTADDESIFCKGLPVVQSVLRKSHPEQDAVLSRLFTQFEQEADLRTTVRGRFVIDLIRRFDTIDKSLHDNGLPVDPI